MAMITYPLNNVEYTAEDAELYNSTRTSGVYSGNDFSWTLTEQDNSITVGSGLAWIKNADFSGKVVAHKEPETFDFGIAPLSNGRVDVLAIRFSSVENGTSLVIKKGVEDGSFEIPERSTSEGVYELYLFAVRRNAGALQITSSDITDLRDDRDYCGYMTEAVKDGYAPSLMEHNKGADFRFWVGTEEEYEEQKDNLPPNTFCVTTGGPVILKSWQDVDGITDVGWYRFNSGISAGGVNANYAYMRVDGYNEKHATQTLYLIAGGTRHILKRSLITSTWETDWSWVNPPMVLGEEYKTTEKHAGEYVYAKAVRVGVPNGGGTATVTVIDKKVGDSVNIVDVSGSVGEQGNYDYWWTLNDLSISFVDKRPQDKGSITMSVKSKNADIIGGVAIITIKYTK